MGPRLSGLTSVGHFDCEVRAASTGGCQESIGRTWHRHTTPLPTGRLLICVEASRLRDGSIDSS